MLRSLPEIKKSPKSSESRTDEQEREKSNFCGPKVEQIHTDGSWVHLMLSKVNKKITPWLHNQSMTALAEKKKSHHSYCHCYLHHKQLKSTKPTMQLLPAALASSSTSWPSRQVPAEDHHNICEFHSLKHQHWTSSSARSHCPHGQASELPQEVVVTRESQGIKKRRTRSTSF